MALLTVIHLASFSCGGVFLLVDRYVVSRNLS